MKCGQNLPDDANFCSRCGVAQSPQNSGGTSGGDDSEDDLYDEEERWETCEILVKVINRRRLGKSDLQFVVRGIGLGGPYLVAATEVWQGSESLTDRAAHHIHSRLVYDLARTGWDVIPGQGSGTPDPRNPNWYALHFRRRAYPDDE